MITIKKAKESDFEGYYRIWYQMELMHQKKFFKGVKKELFKINFNKDLKNKIKKIYLKIIRKRKDCLFIALENNKVIGFIEIGQRVAKRPTMKLNKIKEGFIWDLAMDKKHQGKGNASLLKKESYQWFKARKIKYVYLSYDPNNKHAERVYKKWGFIIDMKRVVAKIK